MAIAEGDYDIGPPASRLLLRTYRQGLAARAGHDLLIEARDWRGHVHVPGGLGDSSAVSVSVEVDLRQLEVLEGTGGVKPLTDSDRREIKKTMQGPLRIAEHPVATFRSSSVHATGDEAMVEGELAIAGETHPLRLQVNDAGGGTVSGRAEIVQTRWGIKPYSGFFGALKLRDAVDVELTVDLRSG
jgi:hypothetical protein